MTGETAPGGAGATFGRGSTREVAELFRGSKTETRGQVLRGELGESWDHALRAAGHAAGGVRAAVGPKVGPAAERFRAAATNGWGSTRAALAPLREAAQREAAQRAAARRRPARTSRRRWPVLVGLVAAGAAVGGTAAYVLRRRRQRQWEEYELAEAAPEATPEVTGVAGGRAADDGRASPATGTTGGAGPATVDASGGSRNSRT